jgi:hypothetical protein
LIPKTWPAFLETSKTKLLKSLQVRKLRENTKLSKQERMQALAEVQK